MTDNIGKWYASHKGDLKMSDEVVYSFAIPKDIKRSLEEIAEEGHRTLAGQIRLILEEYLEKRK